ncbi:hypothetical protein H4R20_002341, partial [Coemansia guatemalensis]
QSGTKDRISGSGGRFDKSSEKPAPRRVTSGNVKKLEKPWAARGSLSFVTSPRQSPALPRVPLRTSRVSQTDIKPKRKAVAQQANTQITFVNAMQAAKARANNVLRGRDHAQETQEIHIDNSSDDEVTARGRVEKRPAANIDLRTPQQPRQSAASTDQAQRHSEISKSVSRTIDGFGSPYKSNSLDRAGGGRAASKAAAVELADDVAHGSALTPSRIVDRMRPRICKDSDESKQKISNNEDEVDSKDVESRARAQTNGVSSRSSKLKMAENFMRVLRSPSQESNDTPRRRSIGSTAQSKPISPSASSRRKSTTPKKQGASIPTRKLPLLGVQIGKYVERTDELSSSRADKNMHVSIKYAQRRLAIQGLRGGEEHMIIGTSDIALVEHMSHNGLAVLRITPTDGMENIFDQLTFDPSSSEPNLSVIYLCLKLADKDSDPISRLVTLLEDDTRVARLDPAIYRQYVHEFTRPFSVDLISSDEEGSEAKSRSQHTASASMNGVQAASDAVPISASIPRYWGSIDAQSPEAFDRGNKVTSVKCGQTEGMATYGKRKQQATLFEGGSANLSRRASSTRYKLRKTRNSSMAAASFLAEDNSDEDDFVVQHREFSGEDHSLRFEYPCGGPKAISVTGSDISRLYHGEFLNDTILEFYMRYITENLRSANPTLYSQCFFFNTFFFKKLSQRSKGALSDPEVSHVDAVYKRLRKWTANVELFDKRYIFVPIHENTHWYLAIIVNSEAMLPGDSSSASGSEASGKEDAKGSKGVCAAEKSIAVSADSDEAAADPANRLGSDYSTDSSHIKGTTSDSNGRAKSPEAQATDRDGDVEMADVAGCSEQEEPNKLGDGDEHKPAAKAPSCDAIDLSSPENKQGPDADAKSSPDTDDYVQPATVTLELMGIKADIPCAKYVDPLNTPAIIILDSLGNRHQQTFGLLRAYMRAEASSRRNVDVSQVLQVGKYAKVPLQNNFCDCGVYLLQYVEEFLKHPHDFMALALNGVNMRSMFTSAQMQQKRYDILNLAKSLVEGYKRQSQSSDHKDANHSSAHGKEHKGEESSGSSTKAAGADSNDASAGGTQDESSAADTPPVLLPPDPAKDPSQGVEHIKLSSATQG